jgi:prepilin-type processing-associated H-X9-DG protein
MIGEASYRGSPPSLANDGVIAFIYPPGFTRPHGDINVFGALANRHSGGGNIAYCDGHAKWNKMEAAHKIENFRTQN